MKSGVSIAVKPNSDPDLLSAGMTFIETFAEKGWTGPLNIQLQRQTPGHDYKAYEFNGRFTGATAARYFLGYDSLGIMFKTFLGYSLPKDERFNSQKIVHKKPVNLFVYPNNRQMLESSGVWERLG